MKSLLSFFTIASCLSAASIAQIPAFPGAEGYGGRALGGRGGDVYIVTNLNTSGAGSFADAISTVPTAGRTIVFGVSGHIHVNKTTLSKSKVTIAGQTAPGDGIGFKDGTFIISGDDIVIRHARFRYGKKDAGGDCINLSSGTLNAILDQVSIQFSTDENISSFNSPPENLTMQWALNGWGLESHSCGGLWDQNHATAHHSLWSHNHTRNPKARPNGLLEWINNVTYDWDIGFIMGDSETPAAWKANVMGNYFLAPAGNIRTKALEKATVDRNGAPNFSVHLANNRHDSNGDGILNGTDKGYTIVNGSEFVAGDPPGANRYVKSPAPFANTGAVPVTLDDPTVAFKKIVSKAGALRLDVSYAGAIRDEVDAKMVSNLVTQARQHISTETSLGLTNGGFGTLTSAAAPTDTDQDGMPDFYETALGWNIAVKDHNTALANSGGLLTGTTFMPAGTVAGYTRLEEYLHFLAIPHGSVPKNVSGAPTSIAVNMAKFTSGFSASPVFTTANASGGSVAVAGGVATFTPTLNYTGRARFDFTVTDSAGHSWTQTCALVVTNSGLPRTIKWAGDGAGNVWAPGVANWTHNGAATSPGLDDLIFDDTGSQSPAVGVPNGVGNVFASMTVNATGNYTISAPTGGYLIGPLTKRGTGTLTIATTGTTSLHPTVLEEGTLAVTSGVGLGSVDLTLAGGTLVPVIDMSPPNVAVSGNVNINPNGTRAMGGTWSGAGVVNLNIGNNTFSLTGNTSAFAGTFALGSSTGFLRLFGSLGSPSATFDVGTSTADLINRNGNATFELGALIGGSGTLLGGASSVNASSTYSIGANGASTTFAGTIVNGGSGGVTNINKVGGGILTLTGANTYTGTTSVSAGSLAVNGSIASATTVISGATLRGSGTYSGGVTTQTGAKVSPGPGSGTIGTLTASNGFTATSTDFSFGLSATPDGVNDKISITGGTGTVSGTNNFDITFAEGTLGAGNYKLIECAAGVPLSIGGGMVMNLTTDAPANTRQTFALTRTASGTAAGYIQLEVTGNAANLVWTGALNAATWDLNTTANFNGNTFYNFDSVTLDDTSANRTVTLAGSLEPRLVNVNTTLGYTLGGAGALGGTGSLSKAGAGTLTISNANTFTGNVVLNAGNIQLANATANAGGLGTSTVTLNGGTLKMFSAGDATHAGTLPNNLNVTGNATLQVAPRCGFSGDVFGAGILSYFTTFVRADITGDWSAFSGTVYVTTDAGGGDFRIASSYNWPGMPLATVNLAASTYFYYNGISNSGTGTTIEIGELRSDAGAHLRGGVTGGRALTYRIGGKTPLGQEAVFRGDIIEQNTSTLTNYVKTGAGTWRLLGTVGAWAGSTTVDQGTLILENSVVTCNGATDVETGGALYLSDGSGLETDALNIAVGATLSSTEDVDIIGDLNNDGTANFYAGQINVSGDVVNNGTMRFHSGALFFPGTDFVNNGTLDLLASPSTLPVNFTNNGTVILNTERRILTAAKAAANLTVTAHGYAGHTYQLQRADTLGGAWTSIGAQQNGGGATLSFTDVGGATGAARFYRLVVGP